MNRALGDFVLRPGFVLIVVPPKKQDTKVQLISTDLETFLAREGIEEFQRLLKVPKADLPAGKVVQIGPETEDVWPGDFVLLEPEAAVEVIEWPDAETGRMMPHLLVREEDISAVVEPTT